MTVFVLTLLCGVIVLSIGADCLVRGGSALARACKLPPLLVGLTVVAFGASAPEFAIALRAVTTGASDLAIGAVAGSSMANLLLVLGLGGLLAAIPTATPGALRHALFAVLAAAALFALAGPLSARIDGLPALDPARGAVLLGGIAAYLTVQGALALRGATEPELAALRTDAVLDGIAYGPIRIALLLLVAAVLLPFGAVVATDAAGAIAAAAGWPQVFVGASILALAGALPEIAAVIAATVRRHGDLAIGNALGSTVFNLFAVTGVLGLAGPVAIPASLEGFDLLAALAAAGLIALLVLTRRPIGRVLGALLALLWAGYLVGSAFAAGVIGG